MEREAFLNPKDVFDQVDIRPGMTVADFGCGAGFFSIELARRVGNDGKVWAFDVLVQALDSVRSAASLEGLQNIETRRVNLEKDGGSKLPDASVDFIILKDMLFQNKLKHVIIKEAHRILKQGGQMVVIEWMREAGVLGPHESLRIPKEDVKILLEETGFIVEKSVHPGGYHYGFLVRRI